MSNNLYERGEILKIAAHLWLLSLLIYPPLEPHNEDRNNRIREYPRSSYRRRSALGAFSSGRISKTGGEAQKMMPVLA